MSGFYLGAPGRAHLLGGESPLLARQGEELARGKGFAGDCESEGSPMAKRWPDEQEADMRRRIGVRWPNSPKPETCTQRCDVNPTGISVKVGAQYPGRSGCDACNGLPAPRGGGRSGQKSAEGIVGGGQGDEPTRTLAQGPNKWKRE